MPCVRIRFGRTHWPSIPSKVWVIPVSCRMILSWERLRKRMTVNTLLAVNVTKRIILFLLSVRGRIRFPHWKDWILTNGMLLSSRRPTATTLSAIGLKTRWYIRWTRSKFRWITWQRIRWTVLFRRLIRFFWQISWLVRSGRNWRRKQPKRRKRNAKRKKRKEKRLNRSPPSSLRWMWMLLLLSTLIEMYICRSMSLWRALTRQPFTWK